jgi:hypothetical protein
LRLSAGQDRRRAHLLKYPKHYHAQSITRRFKGSQFSKPIKYPLGILKGFKIGCGALCGVNCTPSGATAAHQFIEHTVANIHSFGA